MSGGIEGLVFPIILISSIAILTDLVRGKIHNKLTYSATLIGLIHVTATLGPSGLGTSLLSVCGVLLLFLPLYYLKVLGAGDVKLMAVFAVWGGWSYALNVAFLSLLFGGIFAVINLIYRRRFMDFHFRLRAGMANLLKSPDRRERVTFDSTHRFPFALAMGGASVICLYFSPLAYLGVMK